MQSERSAALRGVDAGRTVIVLGTNRERPGLREALAACLEGDTLVGTKLDRLARSPPDARAIADELTVRQVRINLGGSGYDPTGPVGGPLFKCSRWSHNPVRPDSVAHPRGDEGRQGQRASAWQAAKLNIGKKRTLRPCSKAASTAPLNSPTCSAPPDPRSAERWSESEPATSSASAPRTADGSLGCPAGRPLRDSTALLVLKTFGHRSTFAYRDPLTADVGRQDARCCLAVLAQLGQTNQIRAAVRKRFGVTADQLRPQLFRGRFPADDGCYGATKTMLVRFGTA